MEHLNGENSEFMERFRRKEFIVSSDSQSLSLDKISRQNEIKETKLNLVSCFYKAAVLSLA